MAYTIQRGDTLSSIAKRNNTTVSDIMAANPNIKDKNVIRAGASLNLPGASSSGNTGSGTSSSEAQNTNRTYKENGQVVSSGSSNKTSGHTTYGNGSYGGKYLGSNQTAAYQNMENAPGSTGYEKGTLSGYARRKDENGDIYYEHVSRDGVLPLGTSFRATGSALADAQGVPDSSGIFAYAKGRTPGYIEHASGYKGYGYQDAKGNFYDANGNFIREDNFYYEPGATISKNGIYQDTGSGWGHAGYGMWGFPGNYIAVKGENYGKAPGTQLETFTRSSGGGTSAPVASTPAATPSTPVQTPTVEEVQQALGNTYINNMAHLNNTADVVPSAYDILKAEDALKKLGLY